MNPWVAFFVGTPQRFLGTVAGVMLIISMIYPPFLEAAVANLLTALAPLIQPLLVLAFTIAGLRMMFGGLFGGGGGKGRKK